MVMSDSSKSKRRRNKKKGLSDEKNAPVSENRTKAPNVNKVETNGKVEQNNVPLQTVKKKGNVNNGKGKYQKENNILAKVVCFTLFLSLIYVIALILVEFEQRNIAFSGDWWTQRTTLLTPTWSGRVITGHLLSLSSPPVTGSTEDGVDAPKCVVIKNTTSVHHVSEDLKIAKETKKVKISGEHKTERKTETKIPEMTPPLEPVPISKLPKNVKIEPDHVIREKEEYVSHSEVVSSKDKEKALPHTSKKINIVAKPAKYDSVISEEKLVSLEEQIETVDDNVIKKFPNLDNKQNELQKIELSYIEVEKLANDVLTLDPTNKMVLQLTPHIEGVLKHLEEGKMEGLQETLAHVKLLLEDAKARIQEGVTTNTENIKEDEGASSGSPVACEAKGDCEEKEPVEEVVPDPVYIHYLGDQNEKLLQDEVVIDKESADNIIIKESSKAKHDLSSHTSTVLTSEQSVINTDKMADTQKSVQPSIGIKTAPVVDDIQSAESEIQGHISADKYTKTIPSHINSEVIYEKADIVDKTVMNEYDITMTEKNSEKANDKSRNLLLDEVETDKLKETASDVKTESISSIDAKIIKKIKEAQLQLEKNPAKALDGFTTLLHEQPKSALALYGQAQSLDRLAELEKCNNKLEQAIMAYRKLIDLAGEDSSLVPDQILRKAGDRCVDRMRFIGHYSKAVKVQQFLVQHFPTDIEMHNQLGVTYLMMNNMLPAKDVFKKVLKKWPNSGFAQVHYGFILKVNDNDYENGVFYLEKGIQSKENGTQDGRFFYHLGDALQRIGRNNDAYKVYDKGVKEGLFLSRYQRSLYNINRLKSKPFWSLEETTYEHFFRKLEKNWEIIRNEGISILSSEPSAGFQPESENLQDNGDWKQFELFARGRKLTANCQRVPRTCSLIEEFAPAARCTRGQVKFSIMFPGTHVWPHTGPTNCRLRAHLGLVVPHTSPVLRVANEPNRIWEEGKIFVFDDSWEHEVWHDGKSYRLVLIVDVWHPEITQEERKTLPPI